jgi:uncharacterized membrane protein (TIGR02234 family)
MRVSRGLVVVATVVSGGLLLISGAQPWVVLALASAESSTHELVITGATLAPSFVGLSLTYVAALIVSLISRPVVRIVSSAVAVGAVIGAALVSSLIVSDPVAAARVSIARVTGISDTVHQRDLIDVVTLAPWAFIALFVLGVSAIVGIVGIIAGRSWTSNSRRYERRNTNAASQGPRAQNDADDPHTAWDAFSGGGDPTGTSSP